MFAETSFYLEKWFFKNPHNSGYICNVTSTYLYGAVVVMIIWLLDLQLPMKLVPINT